MSTHDCPECRGSGRIELFTSSRACGACGGRGRVSSELTNEARDGTDPQISFSTTDVNELENWIRLNSSSSTGTCPESGGTSTFTITKSDTEGWINYGNGTSSSTTSITFADGTGETYNLGCSAERYQTAFFSDDVTVGNGSDKATLYLPDESSWTLGDSSVEGAISVEGDLTVKGSLTVPAISIGDGEHSTFLGAGAEDPNIVRPGGPVGSLYVRNDGEMASLWFRKDSRRWVQMSSVTEEGPQTKPVELSSVLKWAIQKFHEIDEQRNGEPAYCYQEFDLPGVVPSAMPCVAPLGVGAYADMMMILEQEGHQVEAFVASCLDFADVLKLDSAVQWDIEGNARLFGVPFLRSHEISPGYVGVVSKQRLMQIALVTR